MEIVKMGISMRIGVTDLEENAREYSGVWNLNIKLR